MGLVFEEFNTVAKGLFIVVRVYTRVCAFACVRVRVFEYMSVCVCVCEREKEQERERASERERVCVCVRACVCIDNSLLKSLTVAEDLCAPCVFMK